MVGRFLSEPMGTIGHRDGPFSGSTGGYPPTKPYRVTAKILHGWVVAKAGLCTGKPERVRRNVWRYDIPHEATAVRGYKFTLLVIEFGGARSTLELLHFVFLLIATKLRARVTLIRAKYVLSGKCGREYSHVLAPGTFSLNNANIS
jgi:hypothetical protein